MSEPLLLDVKGLTKRYPGAVALDGVDLQVKAGEVHCLVGQNGAGKSTLIKCIGGSVEPTEGSVSLLGEPIVPGKPLVALQRGVATMYQELDLVNDLSVADNIFLGNELRTGPFVNKGAMRREARRLLTRLGHKDLDADTRVGRLRPAEKQLVSMARALSRNVRLLIMDEPTAILDPPEVDALFEMVKRLTDDGVGVIFISHRMDEIPRIGNRLTVLRDGKSVAANLQADTPTDELISYMVGRKLDDVFPEHLTKEDRVVMSVQNIMRRPAVVNASFEVRAGEILGVAGLVGAGRTELLRAIYGLDAREAGTVVIDGVTIKPNRPDLSIENGLVLAPEERKSQGLWLGWSQIRNAVISDMSSFGRFGFTDGKAEAKAATKPLESLNVAPRDPHKLVGELSGGNQQKVVLARWLLHHAKVLLLDEPTRGVDVGARGDLYRVIVELASRGIAIVMVSSELAELVGFCDRVLVMREGELVAELDGPSSEEADVLRHAVRMTGDVA